MISQLLRESLVRLLNNGAFASQTFTKATGSAFSQGCARNTAATKSKFGSNGLSMQWRRHLYRLLSQRFNRQKSLLCNIRHLRVNITKNLPSKSSLISMSFVPFGVYHAEEVQDRLTNIPKPQMSFEEYEMYQRRFMETLVPEKELLKNVNTFREMVNKLDQSRIDGTTSKVGCEDGWELILNKDSQKLWRKPVKNSTALVYRCYGKCEDVAASSIFKVQFEDHLRVQTDRYIKMLTSKPIETMDKNGKPHDWSAFEAIKGTDEVFWVYGLPFPLKARAYRYFRRGVFMPNENLFVIASRSSPKDFPLSAYKEADGAVITNRYNSTMVIAPMKGKSCNELGCEYFLEYEDDPQINLPNTIISMATSDSIPRLMTQISTAARVFFVSNKQECFEATEEFSINPEVRNAYKERKLAEAGKLSSKFPPDTGNKFRSFKRTKSSKLQQSSAESETKSESSETKVESKRRFSETIFDQTKRATPDLHDEIAEVFDKMGYFFRQNSYIFNRISDKDNFIF